MKKIPNEEFFKYVAERLACGDSVRIRLKGNSMFPLLRNNKDTVVLSPCETSELKTMDVVLFCYRNIYILHRIIERKGENLTIQGDGVFTSYERCTTADVIGRVTSVIRASGRRIPVDSREWRFYSSLWRKFEPLRRFILTISYKFIY